MEIKNMSQMLKWNKECCNEVKRILEKENVYLINIMGSPGTGKTSLIVELIKKFKDKYNIAVVQG